MTGMGGRAALRLEFAIIGLGVIALLMIFQPFSLSVFSVGCGLVVLAGLVNNVLPMAQPAVPLRSVVMVALIVAFLFCTVLLISIAAAHGYGAAFLKPPAVSASPLPPAPPFWMQPLVWGLAAAWAVLGVLLRVLSGKG